jgi:hypothetical protein
MTDASRVALTASAACPGTDSAKANGPVAEIVTFRLLSGTDETAFLADASATKAVVAAQPGFLRRSLSRDESGLWTDYVEWADLPSALAAADVVIALPEFVPFGAAIDPEGLVMRHAPIVWSMEK